MQAPAGLPEECPFSCAIKAAYVLVHLEPGLDEMAIKKQLVQEHEFKCVHLELEASKVEASHEASALKDELVEARAAAGAAGYCVPAALAQQLLQQRAESDRSQAWKEEWARRNRAASNAAGAEQVQI